MMHREGTGVQVTLRAGLLGKNCPYAYITGIHLYHKRELRIWVLQEWVHGQVVLELFKVSWASEFN